MRPTWCVRPSSESIVDVKSKAKSLLSNFVQFSFESVNISRLPSFRFYWLVLCVCVCVCLCLSFGWLAAGICFRLGRG